MASNLDVPFANLRLQNMIGPSNPISSSMTSSNPMMGNEVTPPEISHKYTDIYDQLIGQMPHEDKPSVLRKIVASMAGFGGGPKAADEVLSEPHNKAMGEWKTKLDVTKPLLDAEKSSNLNERYMYSSRLGADTANRRLAETQRNNNLVNEDRDYANQIKEMVARGGQLDVDELTGKSFIVYKDGRQVPIDVNKVPKLQLEQMKADAAMERARVIASTPRVTISQGTTTTEKPSSEVLPTQQKAGKYLAAQNMFNQHPEWQSYIQLADPGTNEYSVEPPKKSGIFGFGVNPVADAEAIKTRDAIIKAIDVEAAKINAGSSGSTSTTKTNRISTSAKTPPKLDHRREDAIKALTDAKLPVTEANIKHLVDQVK
jgi:hypothetical protein